MNDDHVDAEYCSICEGPCVLDLAKPAGLADLDWISIFIVAIAVAASLIFAGALVVGAWFTIFG